MTGWLLILAVLVLGGVLSNLGDRLGSRIGKARLSLFRMRPKKTAVLITVLTGSLISALTLGLMVAVSEQLRVGLFQLEQLEDKLRSSRKALQLSLGQLDTNQRELEQARREREKAEQQLQRLNQSRQDLEQERERLGQEVEARDQELQALQQRTAQGQQELRQLERNVLALRSGDVVLSTGQPLTMAKVAIPKPGLARQATEDVLRQANVQAYQQVLPGLAPERQLLLIPRSEVSKVESALKRGGPWVVSILSAGNVLRGEKQVLAFADVRPSRKVVSRGDVLASVILDPDERELVQVDGRLQLLLAAARTEARRRGSLAPNLQVDRLALQQAAQELVERPSREPLMLEVLAQQDSETADPVLVELRANVLSGS
ncbi:MAG: DUF3084 domain-containing protein [Synechococcus sp. MED-G71]|nr:MAG: DUF3084 domain-containing protein [Synechococcus sp. MED-G71]